MNNAALLEAYATLGISPRPAEIKEQSYPDGFSLTKALAGIAFGQEDISQHPGKLHQDAPDPIAEAEQKTSGKADDTLSLAAAISARFASQTGDGGDLGSLVSAAIASAGLPEIDFDFDVAAIGASMLSGMGEVTSSVPDFAGSAPFTGMRMDYRPESAPMGPKKTTANRHSYESTHIDAVDTVTAVAATLQEIARGRWRGAGTGMAPLRQILTGDTDE